MLVAANHWQIQSHRIIIIIIIIIDITIIIQYHFYQSHHHCITNHKHHHHDHPGHIWWRVLAHSGSNHKPWRGLFGIHFDMRASPGMAMAI